MRLPLKTYRTINYIQLALSVYAIVWLNKFFVSSVSCNMIDNHNSATPFTLRFGQFLLPECSPGGDEWVITPFMSIILRIVMVAWIVVSVYVFFRIQRISKYVSSSEPVEMINKVESKGKDSQEKRREDQKSQSFTEKLSRFLHSASVIRWFKIILVVTGLWVLVLILFQGPILSVLTRYVEDEKFYGQIENVTVKFTKNGVANISMLVDGKPVILRSDKNIENVERSLDSTLLHNGTFVGLENYDLYDPLLVNCLVGSQVDVFAKRSGVFYSLDGNERYYVRFSESPPSCQKNYVDKCVIGGTSYGVGDVVYQDGGQYYCECTLDGLNCYAAADSHLSVQEEGSCTYNSVKRSVGDQFRSKDSCSQCLCNKDGVSCEVEACKDSTYELSKDMEVPLHYWFVDEPDASEYVYITVGGNDDFQIVSDKAFGQSPKTEVKLDGGKATLVFSVSHVGYPFYAFERHPIEGNENVPDLQRVYSPQTSRYIYSRGELEDGCGESANAYGTCVAPVVGNLEVECVSSGNDYVLCDSVMKTVSFENPDLKE